MDTSQSGSKEEKPDKKQNIFLNWFKEFSKGFRAHLHDPRFVIELLALTGLIFYVCETRRTNNLTRQALGDAQKHFEQDQRAWVSVKHVELVIPYSSDKAGKVSIQLINGGKTPALRIDLVGAAFGEKVDNKTRFHNIDRSRAVTIGPGLGDNTLFLEVPPTNPNVRANLVFVIQYWDVFQKLSDTPHTTTFCGYYPTDTLTTPPTFANTSFGPNDGCGVMN